MDANRLLAPGVTVMVAGGERQLRFNLLALKRLEEWFGNLETARLRINALLVQDFEERLVTDLGFALAAGLNMTSPDEALHLFDGVGGDAVGAATGAVFAAWLEAWPNPDDDEVGKAEAGASPSPGVTSTTAPPSNGVVTTTSSGT